MNLNIELNGGAVTAVICVSFFAFLTATVLTK